MNKYYRLFRYDWPLHFVLVLTNWLPDNVIWIRLRGWLASPFFKSCGKKLGIGRNVTFYNPSRIVIGNDVYIALGCWFSSSFNLIIEDQVLFSPYVVIATSNHTRENGSFRFGKPIGKAITIGKGSWIGAHCTITQGTNIGYGSVIGANSFINFNIPSQVLAAGNPAKILKNYQ